MVANIRPLGAQVVLSRVKAEVSLGGIIIPEAAQNREATFWDVVAVGPGRLVSGEKDLFMYCDSGGEDVLRSPRNQCEVKPGDRVALLPTAHLKGGEIEVTTEDGGRKRLLVIHEDAIVAVVT